MSHPLLNNHVLIAQLRESLTRQGYTAKVVRNHCTSADCFLHYLLQRRITVEAVTPAEVSNYLHRAARQLRQRHGHSPPTGWLSRTRAGIHAFLRLMQKRWPPEFVVSNPREAFCEAVCREYQNWLRVHRGLAVSTVDDLVAETRRYLLWYTERTGALNFKELGIADIDAYFAMRAPGLRRVSRHDVAKRLRFLMRFLHATGRTTVDLARQIITPTLYAYEPIPSVLDSDQISTVLQVAHEDRSPRGLRDYAILLLLSTYGMRAGEIRRLRLEDIDWRAEALHVRHSKTGGHLLLPLMPPVGEALLNYLRRGRPKTDVRQIFIRTRAPYLPLSSFYKATRGRVEAAGVKPRGKAGPHAFRHARAVSLLRASVPRKVIGDLLGHRSEKSTIPYLKLATEDLREVALEIPGQEVH